MKNLLLTPLFVAVSMIAYSQVQNTELNSSVKSTFEAKYNAIPASYTTYGDGTVFAAHASNTEWSVFKVDGTYLQNEKNITAAEVPAVVKQDATQRFGTNVQYRKVVLANNDELISLIYTKGTGTVEVYYNLDGTMNSRAIR